VVLAGAVLVQPLSGCTPLQDDLNDRCTR